MSSEETTSTGSHPSDPSHVDPLDDLVAEYLALADREGDAAAERFLAEHSGHGTDLPERIQALRDVGLLGGRGTGAPSGSEVPERLGEFRLIRRIGSGGMGVVYLAEQESLGRTVALKLIRPEHMYFGDARNRFRREVEAVAKLHHPGIAAVYTVGEENGLPYFAMEYIEGTGLDDVLRRLLGKPSHSLRGRDLARIVGAKLDALRTGDSNTPPQFAGSWVVSCLSIARQLADALAHAHAHGIVHRDVKPSNVLLTSEGRVVLVDFGLARPEGATRLTVTGTPLGTLLYMAPEQVAGAKEISGARLDVYSLGVVLCELLCLEHPFAGGTEHETRTRILHADPVQLRKRVRGLPWDVETVCLKAMDPDPTRRYSTAAEFSRDLSNVLEFRPIEAKRAGAPLRTRRWVQRHPTMAVGALLGFLLTIVAPVVAGVSIQGQRDRAIEQARVADKSLKLIVSVFERADPSRNGGREMTAREVFEDKTRDLAKDVKDDPSALAPLLLVVGDINMNLGAYDRAQELISGALELNRSLYGEESLQFAQSLRSQGRLLTAQQSYARALEPLERALAIRKRLLGSAHPDFATSLYDLGRLRSEQHYASLAEPLLRDAIQLRRKLPTEQQGELVEALLSLARTYRLGRRYREATEVLEEALPLARRVCGNEHALTIDSMQELGALRAFTGRWSEAEALFMECLSLAQRLHHTDDHPAVIGIINAIAELYCDEGRFADAETYFRRSLEGHRKHMNLDSSPLVDVTTNLAGVLRELGKLDEAERLGLEALEISTRAATDPDRPGVSWAVAQASGNLGRTYEAMGNLAEAEIRYRRAAEMAEQLSGPKPYALGATASDHLARIAAKRGDAQAAEGIYRRALATLVQTLGADGDHHDRNHLDGDIDALVELLQKRGDADGIDRFRREMLESVRSRVAEYEAMSPDQPRYLKGIATGHRTIGKLLSDLGEFTGAESILLRATRELAEEYEEFHPKTMTARSYLEALYTKWGKAEKAAEIRAQNVHPVASSK